MPYPTMPDLAGICRELGLYGQLKHEYGAKAIEPILKKAERDLNASLRKLKALPVSRKLAAEEPNDLESIRALRPKGPRRMWASTADGRFGDRLEGALLGRFAGCTLGAPVEFWPIDRMERLAEENGDAFPPTDYWKYVPDPEAKRYQVSPVKSYTRPHMKGVPVDDDLAYTLLGLLVLEDHGPDFAVEDIGKAWVRYLPYACTAEDVALRNLNNGVPARKAGEKGNPFCEWIGADIRSDPWGYLAPGWPERAARMAWTDAYISHRRNGIYGEMFFSAAIAAAFTVDHPVEALEIGLTEIPKGCATAKAVRWALKTAPKVRNYKQARQIVDRKFRGMAGVHTINNACLTVFGLTIGGTDFTRVIGETVAMGLDNDCTGATAGSIAGAVVGKKGVPRRWYARFGDRVESYLKGRKRFRYTDLVKRFARQAARVHASSAGQLASGSTGARLNAG